MKSIEECRGSAVHMAGLGKDVLYMNHLGQHCSLVERHILKHFLGEAVKISRPDSANLHFLLFYTPV